MNTHPSWHRAVLIGAAALLPALLTVLLIRFHLNAQITDFRPHYWNDQVGYWHYIYSFSEHGFGIGYYTPDEFPAQIGPFDLHGPAFPVLMGSIAHFTGWYVYSSIYYNMALIAAGVVLLCVIGQLDRLQIILVGAVAATQWAILIYIPTASQESLHHFGAMVLAALFWRMLSGAASWGLKLGGLVLLFVLALVRFSWGLLFLPYLLLVMRSRRWYVWLVAAAISAGLLMVVMNIVSMTSAPGGSSVIRTINTLLYEPETAISDLIEQVIAYIKYMFDFQNSVGDAGHNIEFVGVLIAAALAWGYYAYRRHIHLAYTLHLYNLGSILLLSLLFYLPTGYLRVLGIHLLLSVLLLVLQRNFRLVYAVVGVNLLTIGLLFGWYTRWFPNFHLNVPSLESEQAALETHLIYDPNADSRWCNTVLIPLGVYNYTVTLIPPGFGISYIWRRDIIDFSLESKYLILEDEDLDWVHSKGARTQFLARLRESGLYLNLDSDCVTDSSASTIRTAALPSP